MRRTPDQDDCRPNCHNVACTDRDIAELRARVTALQELTSDYLFLATCLSTTRASGSSATPYQLGGAWATARMIVWQRDREPPRWPGLSPTAVDGNPTRTAGALAPRSGGGRQPERHPATQAIGDAGRARHYYQSALRVYTDLELPEADDVRVRLAELGPGAVPSTAEPLKAV